MCGWIGEDKSIRLLYCRGCKARFSERKGTPLDHAKLPRRRWFPSWSTPGKDADRHENARKGRKTYRFSKHGDIHN
ncbi:MAG: hypothetical protein ACOC8E_04915, partial [Planctomycetota bacterium]